MEKDIRCYKEESWEAVVEVLEEKIENGKEYYTLKVLSTIKSHYYFPTPKNGEIIKVWQEMDTPMTFMITKKYEKLWVNINVS